jgi:hypothetical protein
VKTFPDTARELAANSDWLCFPIPKTRHEASGGDDGLPVFQVDSLRPCRRIGPDGQERLDLVCEVVQKRRARGSKVQEELDDARVKAKETAPRFQTGFFDFGAAAP